jgi:DHA2 family multidrug resistance protein
MPQLLQGAAIAFFFVPMVSINLGGIEPGRVANATSLQNFLRMLAGSFGASLVITAWDRRQALHRTQLAEHLSAFAPPTQDYLQQLQALGLPAEQSYGVLDNQLTNQAFMLATNDIFWVMGWIFLVLMALVWTTKPPFGGAMGSH